MARIAQTTAISHAAEDTVLSVQADRLTALSHGAREHGDVMPFRRGIIFSHPDAVRDILVTHDAKFGKAPALRWARWTLGQGLLTADGPLHRKQRPLIQPALHPKRLADYADVMVRFAAETAGGYRDQQLIDAHREMTRLTLHIVATTLFGTSLGPEVDAISHAMDLNVRAFTRMTSTWGRILAFMPSPSSFRYLLARHRVISTLRRFVAQRRASNEVKDDLLGRLLAARTPDGQPAMSEQQLVDECVTLFAAGHETTAGTLTFALWLLANHPKVQAKLHAELDAVLPNGTRANIDHVEQLPYTRQVIAESIRLFPPAWIQGRQAQQDCTINGTPIRAGQVVFVSQWLTHRDERWWSQPGVFDPDRFALSNAEESRPRWAYFPFGGGSRVCVGEAFAWTEAVLVLATLARQWRFTSTPSDRPLRLEPGITLRPLDKIELRVHGRA